MTTLEELERTIHAYQQEAQKARAKVHELKASRTLDYIRRICPDCGHQRGEDYEADGCPHCTKEKLNAALAENAELVACLRDIVANAKARDGFQCGAPSLVTMYIRAEFIENARILLPKNPIPDARQLLADTTDAVAGMQNEVHAKTL